MLASDGRALGARFWRMMGATAVSSVGDGLLIVALPLLAAAITKDPLAVAGVLATGRAARAICAIPAGQLVDALDRHSVLFFSLVAPALALAGLAVDLSVGRGDLLAIYACAVIVAACRVAYDLAMQASVPDMVPSDALAMANSRLQSTEGAGEQFVGPMVGGFVFGLARRLPVIGDAVSFVAAAVFLGRGGRARRRRAQAAATPAVADVKVAKQLAVVGTGALMGGADLADDIVGTGLEGVGSGEPGGGAMARMAQGFSFFRRSKALVLLTVVTGTNMFSQSAVLGLLVLYGERQLHLSASGYGLFFALTSAFGVAGAILAGRLHRRFGTGAIFLVGSAGVGCGLALMSYLHWAAIAVVAMGVQDFSTAVGNVGSITARQRLVPDFLYGRVVSVYRAIVGAAAPIGALLAGVASEWVGIPLTFLVAGFLSVTVALGVGSRLRPLLVNV
ncbi:MAG TPA: MFS transporter [Acidimicrobiales bacterium]|nr:MFS transporter [Acidimicrobiales bacterium]